ncbi:MAG: bifunctional diaminohydroxyphosphoribosylaminopyrimidine deaminase/5-amino-6-(5-phosphoribosylamino)uracil reductase RibD [Cyclobacteriaceae bacterium]
MVREQFMLRALQLAELGRGNVSPNPMVGCVIVHEHRIIGEGYHQQFGGAHAEVNAIASVKDQSLLASSDVYVTLEPCSHYGKTPPCSDLLIEKQVRSVIVATSDPNEKVNGQGIAKMQAAGIEVTIGVLEKASNQLNVRFNTFHQHKRPYVILKWAQTNDGFIARKNFDSKWISNSYSRQLVHKWRTEEDAILVGYNTAFYDDPMLNAREWEGKDPLRVLLDRDLQLPTSHHLLDGSIPTMIMTRKAKESSGNQRYIQNDMSPKSILEALYQEGVSSVIIEGGSRTIQDFINTGLWDEARIFTSITEFPEGISAPKLDMNSSEVIDVDGDKLETFYHAKRQS